MAGLSLDRKIDQLARSDRLYSPEAYHFVFEALDFVSDLPRPVAVGSHITVTQLLEGLRDLALTQFGPLARCVFESWGVYGTEDFGEIVFRLIDNDLLNRSDDDRKEDFVDVFSFREAFDEGYQPHIDWSDSNTE